MFRYNIEHHARSAVLTARFTYDIEMETEIPLKDVDVERLDHEYQILRESLLRMAKKYIIREETKCQNTNLNAVVVEPLSAIEL